MINIYTTGNWCIQKCDIQYDSLENIIKDNQFSDNTVIAFRFSDGMRGSIVKKHIVGYEELEDTDNQGT